MSITRIRSQFGAKFYDPTEPVTEPVWDPSQPADPAPEPEHTPDD